MADEKRLEFHRLLLSVTPNAYFQPPANYQLTYPCVIYYRSEPNQTHANDSNYVQTRAYEVAVISRDPEDDTPFKLLEMFPMSSITNGSSAINNLYHINLNIYY